MAVNVDRIKKLLAPDLEALSNADLAELADSLVEVQEDDRRQNQLLFYRPASERAAAIHKSQARIVGVGGGNGSGKSDTVLAEICALATGVFPEIFKDDFQKKFRGPVHVRIVVESLTTTLEPVILPKLQWWKWSGAGDAESGKGHWGWIPKQCLVDGAWEKSWREKTRILRVICRDPKDQDRVLGESTFQFNSHDQDPTDFASGDFHHVMMDEPPRWSIWRENEARTMRVRGRMYLAMTWPDDPSIPVDWIFDEIYEKGVPGPNKIKDVDWFELWTTENVNLDQGAVATQMNAWSEETKNVRIFGQPIRFSNRIHPLFTDSPLTWSYSEERVIAGITDQLTSDTVSFCHVEDFQPSSRWPTIFLLDPHPRKPHMGLWVQVTPNDDLMVVAELEADADPADLRDHVFHVEQSFGLNVVDRMMDPNMGRSPASAIRGITWQDEFATVGLNFALADDSDVGRSRVNEYLRPDNRTMRPRLMIAARCQKTIFQMKRYVWDNYRRADERDLKQAPKSKNDDYPTLLKYLLNSSPSFGLLHRGAQVYHRNRPMAERTRVRA